MAAMGRVDKDSNRAFYDTQRDEDRRRFESGSKAFQAETLVPWVVSHLERGARVLDVAGGSGVYASLIVRAAPVSVIGLDISSSMVRQRSEDPLLPENVVGDMEALPFADGTFDAALFVGCLHHVPDPLPALREAQRVVRPGGTVFAAEPCSLRVGKAGVAPVPGHPHEFRFSLRFLTGNIREAGLRVEEVKGKRLTLRFVAPRFHSPPLWMFRAADRVDRLVTAVPGAVALAELALIRATRPGAAVAGDGGRGTVVCPRCLGALAMTAGELICGDCKTVYRIEDGIPMLLADEAAER
jgi:SAM-dependent methyltransferase